jgi:hypothetical protein
MGERGLVATSFPACEGSLNVYPTRVVDATRVGHDQIAAPIIVALFVSPPV